jgi:hypothetical protein
VSVFRENEAGQFEPVPDPNETRAEVEALITRVEEQFTRVVGADERVLGYVVSVAEWRGVRAALRRLAGW